MKEDEPKQKAGPTLIWNRIINVGGRLGEKREQCPGMSKGPTARDGSCEDSGSLWLEQREKGNMERGSWRGGQTPARDFRILGF